MSRIITDVKFNHNGMTAVNSQDVDPAKRNCHKQRATSIAGNDGLGYLACDIPVVEVLAAMNMGIDLDDRQTREKWLLSHPQYICHVDTGNTGKIIIK
jgi:hypothetical protein